MMSLSSKIELASVIYYLCATSTMIAISVTFETKTVTAANIALSHRTILPSNMNHSTYDDDDDDNYDYQTNEHTEQKSNNTIQMKNRYHNIMVSSSNNATNSTNNGQHLFKMGDSQKYLHLDEYNFVATTPKILTTKLPNR